MRSFPDILGLRLAVLGLAWSGMLTGHAATSGSELASYQEAEKIGKEHLATFDTLDFDVYTNQQAARAAAKAK